MHGHHERSTPQPVSTSVADRRAAHGVEGKSHEARAKPGPLAPTLEERRAARYRREWIRWERDHRPSIRPDICARFRRLLARVDAAAAREMGGVIETEDDAMETAAEVSA